MAKTRSPLPSDPLRIPGQSITDRLVELVLGRFFTRVFVAVLAGALALSAWLSLIFKPTFGAATLASILAAGLAVYAWFGYRAVEEESARLRLGREGEIWVAQYLETNRQPNWRLLNDLPGQGFNIDHVLVAPQGVFAIETKTFSKPQRGEAKVTFDGDRVLLNGRSPDRDPVAQARAQRDWVRDYLRRTTGRDFGVRAVVVFPGWYVTGPDHTGHSDVWVLNPKGVPSFVAHEPETVVSEDVALIASRLADLSARQEWSS